MKKSTKYLIAGGVAAVGIGYWWYTNQQHQVAAAQIASHPMVTAPVNTAQAVVAPSPVITTPSGATTAAGSSLTANQQVELQALLKWALTNKNPPLYTQMMQELNGTQVDGLYNILATAWTTGVPVTPTQTAFWNTLRQQFPMLNTGGVGCNNLQCT